MRTAKLARRIGNLEASPIRDILRAIERPGMISFAGGLPSSESFPAMGGEIPERYLQYGPTEGEPELRQLVVRILENRGLECSVEQVLILAGSQQGIDLVAKLLINDGSQVAVEHPTYLAALQAMSLYGASYRDLAQMDSDTALAYVIPSFQDPTGRCYDEVERLKLAALCDRTDTVLFEDDPYSDLDYDNSYRVPICSMSRSADWVYQGSFSKTFCPGLRLGYLVCSEPLVPYLVRLKQAADLHSCRIGQYHTIRALSDREYDTRLRALRRFCRQKRDSFAQGLEKHFRDLATWRVPAGGLFFWLELNPEIQCDTRQLFELAIYHNVAFMPGAFFYPQKVSRCRQLRLNFSHASGDQMDIGLERLANIVKRQSPTRTNARRAVEMSGPDS